MKAYSSIIKHFNEQTILVIGDLMIDVYLQGSCSRIAPEASIPIVDLNTKVHCLGGAANVAANLKAMGAEVLLTSVTGDDETLMMAKDLLKEIEVSSRYIVADKDRKTLLKTRVGSNSQTLVRYDEGSIDTICTITEAQLIAQIKRAYRRCDAVLIADYNKGVLSDGVLKALYELQGKERKPLAVDAKDFERYAFLQPDFIKPNYKEGLILLEEQEDLNNRVAQIHQNGEKLWKKTQAEISAITMDADGVIVFKRDTLLFHIPAQVSSRPHVCGAGDTFISAGLLALLSSSSMKTAIEIAMQAAFIAIQKEYTAICSIEELRTAFKLPNHGTASSLASVCELHRSQGKRIVFTNGCFDVLHSGHVSYLKAAKANGDILIVGLNKDESVTRLKGEGRPINRLEHRMAVLAELNCVDHVIPFGEPDNDTPINLIKKIKPDVFVKGADYENKFLPELKVLKAIGAEIALIPLVKGQSTTQIIARIQSANRNHKLSLSS